MAGKLIRTHRDLEVYQLAFRLAMEIFRESKAFPVEERYSLTDQVRRSSTLFVRRKKKTSIAYPLPHEILCLIG